MRILRGSPCERVKTILDSDTETVELVLASLSVVWGLSFATPGFDWTYIFLIRIAPPIFWGYLLIIVGLSQFGFVLWGPRQGRQYISMFHFVFWIFILLNLGIAQPNSPAIGTMFVRSCESAWIFIRLKKPHTIKHGSK